MMGEVIAFPLKFLTFRMYDKNKELISAQKLRCPKCYKFKEEGWFILYNNNTFVCVDCSHEEDVQ
tara:strand:+ start:5 stop:199 length:195 start_codon:yes stop_codon:yes gene_type:complete